MKSYSFTKNGLSVFPVTNGEALTPKFTEINKMSLYGIHYYYVSGLDLPVVL